MADHSEEKQCIGSVEEYTETKRAELMETNYTERSFVVLTDSHDD
jgi:hypothetical protein